MQVQYVNKAFEMLTGRNRAVLLGSDGSNEFGGGGTRKLFFNLFKSPLSKFWNKYFKEILIYPKITKKISKDFFLKINFKLKEIIIIENNYFPII